MFRLYIPFRHEPCVVERFFYNFGLGPAIASHPVGALVLDPISIAVASGMRARMESLDMLANNLANSTTSGYKLDREFHNLYLGEEAEGASQPGVDQPPAVLPVVERHWTDFAQGVLTETGNPLNLALSGKGFFAVNGPNGVLYTRNGNFKLSAKGVLETQEGYALRKDNGKPVELDPALPVEFGKDGSLRQGGAEVARLQLVEFAEPQSLSKMGQTYFLWSPPSPTPSAGAAPLVPRPARQVEVHQGRLESSNVAPAESAIRLVSVMRQFEMLQRALTLCGEMSRRAIEDVARVNQ